MHTIAIDWSGSQRGAENRIWLAEAVDGKILRLEAGRSREAVIDEVVAAVRGTKDRVLVGLDFGFSYPNGFLERIGVVDPQSLWELVAEHGEAWLAACEPPFWGRPGKPNPFNEPGPQFRATELDLRTDGFSAKSMFQIGGAGSVGTGSIRGMPSLLVLREAGCAIWPFDPVGRVTVTEMYPRIYLGSAVKSRESARRNTLSTFRLPSAIRNAAASSEDAFDALLSALSLSPIPPSTLPPIAAREGWVWR